MAETETKEKDPTCGMEMDKTRAKAISAYRGKTYYFCSDSCKKEFDKTPKRFVE